MNDALQREAKGRVITAIRRLAASHPFHARVLEGFKIMASFRIQTMAVAAVAETIELWFHIDFVRNLPIEQLKAVLLHEVHHVAFGHLLMDPAAYPDEWARVVAQEVTVNEFIILPLPRGAIKLKHVPGLPPMESTIQRYQRLTQVTERFPVSGMGQGARRVLDDHGVWVTGDPQAAEAGIDSILREALVAVGSAGLPDYLRQVLRVHGTAAGTWCHTIPAPVAGTLLWVRLLRRYAGQNLETGMDLRRPPRRFPHLVGIIPARRQRRSRPTVMAVIDTSASITPDLLAAMNAELVRLAADHTLLVVECDAEIHQVYAYKPIHNVHGRGSTDLRPPFARKFLATHRPDLIIYFTDGMGPAPGTAPHVPVIWCLTPDGVPPVSWGRTLNMV